MAALRSSIALKIFSIAIGLLILMAIAALLSLRMTRTVDGQLSIVDQNYSPAYVSLSQANIRSVEESAYLRRLLLALMQVPRNGVKIVDLRERATAAATESDQHLAEARRHINEQIDDPLDFNDNIQLARLETRVSFIQEVRQQYEDVRAKLINAVVGNATTVDEDSPEVALLLADLDRLRDDIDRRLDNVRSDMRQLAANAIVGTRAYQMHVVEIGVVLLVIAGLLGLLVAAAITMGLVRPVRRLLAGTAAVEQGVLDTVIPVTSTDEIGRLTHAFNTMVGELRVKAQIRDTFGKYVDPRIVEGLIDRPELADPKGARRQMTILFCDMQGFTSFSEGMTPSGLVTVMNRYLTVMSEPVRRNNGHHRQVYRRRDHGVLGPALHRRRGAWPPRLPRRDRDDGCAAGVPGGTAGPDGASPRRPESQRPDRPCDRRGGRRQYRIRPDAKLHCDRRHREHCLAARKRLQAVRDSHPAERGDAGARRRRDRDP
jgi:adenylate cyclase